ncbi:MAG: BMP family ABC transporter substrate-binding protein [Limnohabitans sp.]|nr:BMP family ABC transporter substrate-binding protein [Limnohabitans sp.]
MYKNLIAALSALALFFTSTFAQTVGPSKTPLKVGFVYVTPRLPVGWVHQHELGRLALEQSMQKQGLQVQTGFVDNVSEGADAERVIRDMAQQGYGLIFTPSFGYMEPTMKVAAEFPQVKFESITGYKTAANVATANARYYEGRFLAGIAAGRVSKTGIAGYVAGFPIPEVIQGINAFTLGMQSVNPKAQVKLIWINAWFDPVREREAAMTMMNQKADVLAFHTASDAVMVAAQERGKMAIAYHSDMRHVAPQAQLLAVTHVWGNYYSQRAAQVINGSWQSTQTWGGVREGMIKVEGFGPRLPKRVQTEVLRLQSAMVKGSLQPFTGPVFDNQDGVVLARGQTMTDEQILKMHFLVKGVAGSLP